MTIQQFAEQLKQEDGASPLLRAVQALRTLSLDQISSSVQGMYGWFPWNILPTQESVSHRLELAH